MHKFLFFIGCLVACNSSLWAQKLTVVVNYVTKSNPPDNLAYMPGQLINWTYFQARPAESSDAAAITNAGFGLNLSFKSSEDAVELVIDVSCSFSKRKSWVKEQFKTNYILNHERRHFDLAFIHASSFMQKLRKAKITTTNYASLIEKLYRETADEMSQVQNQYDAQTNHSRVVDKQSEWDSKIARQLDQVLLVERAYTLRG